MAAIAGMAQKSGGAAVRVGIKGNPKILEAATGCTGAVVGLVLSCTAVPGKSKFTQLSVEVGEQVPLTIVTTFDNVVVGNRVVIAGAGSFINEQEVQKSIIGGVSSEGVLCDGALLGWKGGVAGSAAVLPDRFNPGEMAPEEKPKRNETILDAAGNVVVEEISAAAPKQSKEEKKAEAAVKKAARDARKVALKKGEAGGTEDAEEEDAEGDGAEVKVEKILPKAPGKDLKRIKKLAADKRKTGVECWTDDELELAGFAIQGQVEA